MNNLAFQIYGTKKATPFQSVWKTDNAGSSAANQIQLPITSIPVGKSIWIDWGDNSYSNMNSTNIIANRTHTYSTPGEYTVRILGDNFNFGFGPTSSVNDRLKIKSISSWGKLKLGQSSFNSCYNLTMSGITDIPDLTGVNSLSSTFLNCSKITTVGRMNEWNTSGVTIMGAVFNGSVLFNQCIGGWNVSNVTNFDGMFYNCWEFNNGDNSTPLNDWRFSTTSSVSLNYPFILCKKFNRYIGDWNTSNVTIMTSMFDSCTVFNNGFAAGVGTGNQLNWDTSSCINMAGMFGSAPAFNSNISSFNVSKVTTFSQMFYGCNAFNNGFASGDGVGNQLPWNIGGNITGPINMNSMFSPAPAFNSNLGTGTTPWDVSKVTNFGSMFAGASNFNNGDEADITKSKINSWNIGVNVTGVINMNGMFNGASKFNRDISGWDVSKVTSFANMFESAIVFTNGLNQNTNPRNPRIGINGWNINTTATSVSMASMFRNAFAFNREISSWDVSKVTSFSYMFFMSYNVNNVFNNGDNNQQNPTTLLFGLDGWNINTTSTSIDFSRMFFGAKFFNRPIGSWNMNKATNVSGMFEATFAFNQPLSNWDVSNVTNMSAMFNSAIIFNQAIGSWNVSKVTSMGTMFGGATAFNQNIGSWNVSNVTNFSGFMETKTPVTGTSPFSSTNLDAIYNGWIVNGVKPNTTSPLSTNISFGTAKYSQAGKPGRDTLLASPNNWRIADGLLTVSGTSNNGGLIRLTTNTNGFTTGTSVLVNVYDVTGTIAANGTWTALVISSTIIQLQGSTYDAAWTGGGNVILG